MTKFIDEIESHSDLYLVQLCVKISSILFDFFCIDRLTMAALNRRTTHVNSIREIRRFVEGNDFPNSTTQRIRVAQESLQRHYDQFCEVHLELIGEQINQAEFDVHEALKNDIERLVTELQVSLLERAELLNPPAVQPAPVQVPQLPQQNNLVQALELRRLIGQRIQNTWGEFDGTLIKWASFRDFFTSAVHNDGIMPNEVKFQHLKSSLKGEALEVLGDWDVTDANYLLAWQRLNDVYNRMHRTATELLQRLYEIPKLNTATRKSLQHLSNVAHNVKRQLTGLGYDTQGWDLVFISSLEQKLDRDSKIEWELHRDQINPTLQQLLNFIEQRARALAFLQDESIEQKESQKRLSADLEDFPKAKKFVQPENQSNFKFNTPRNCLHPDCNSNHPLYKCPLYLVKDRADREKFVKKNKLCIKCLLPGHFVNTCKRNNCPRCDGDHHGTLCNNNKLSNGIN